jgi:Mn2+/Fe2+ NRAMP family transporter
MSDITDPDTLPPSLDPQPVAGTLAPPTTFLGIAGRLGPGLIIAGSIVGSGELIATTKTGAQAGITLLWLIIVGCVIKVFVGKLAATRLPTARRPGGLTSAQATTESELIIWFWLAMMIVGIGQLGNRGGVGRAIAAAIPIRGDYQAAIESPRTRKSRVTFAGMTTSG